MSPLLDLAFQGLDAHDVGPAEIPAVDPGFDLLQEFAGQIHVAGDAAGLDQRLPLPGAAGDVVVPQSRIDAGHGRPLTPVGTEPQVDAIRGAQARVLRQVLDDLLSHALEEFGAGDGARTVRFAGVVAQEDQVDVAGVVQFLAAQLAHRNRGKPRPLPIGPPRHAALLLQFAARRLHRRFANRIRQHRDLFDHRFQPLAAHDIPVRNPQRFPVLVAAEDRHHVPIVADGLDILADLPDQHLARHRLAFRQPQQVEALRIADQQVAQVLAGAKNLQQRRQRFRVPLEKRSQCQPVSSGGKEPVQIIQRHVGIAERGQMLGQLAGQGAHQIRRDARAGNGPPVGLRLRKVLQPDFPQPGGEFPRFVKTLDQCRKFHASECMQPQLEFTIGLHPPPSVHGTGRLP